MKVVLAAVFLLSAPAYAQAQRQGGMPRVGVLFPAPAPAADWEAFPRALKELGYVDGVNVILDVRVAGDRLDRLPELAGALVKASPDVIVAVNTPGTSAAMKATATIPIIMVAVGDPLAMGFVSNLARPDRNVTGITNLCGELAGKRLEIFKQTLPRAQRVAVLFNVGDPITQPQVRDLQQTAPSVGIEIRLFPVRTKAEVDSSLDAMLKWRADGILWLCGQQRALTRHGLQHASKRRVPVMVAQHDEMGTGGLVAYSANNAGLYGRAAVYVDKILRGAKVSDLPVEQPTKLELVVSKKVAANLGVVIPPSILLRADRVIE